MLALLALGVPVAGTAAYALVPKFRSWVDVEMAKAFPKKIVPGTAPGTTAATTAPAVATASSAPVAYSTNDYGLTVTISPIAGGQWTAAWQTPDGRTQPPGLSYPTSSAAEQGALDLLGTQYVAQAWAVAPVGPMPATPDVGTTFNPAHPAGAPAVSPLLAVPAGATTSTAAPAPGPGAQVVSIPTLGGGVNAYVEPDSANPGNFKATFKMPPGDGDWMVATGASLQAAADSAATTLGLLVH